MVQAAPLTEHLPWVELSQESASVATQLPQEGAGVGVGEGVEVIPPVEGTSILLLQEALRKDPVDSVPLRLAVKLVGLELLV